MDVSAVVVALLEEHQLDGLSTGDLLPCRVASRAVRSAAQGPLAHHLLRAAETQQGAALRSLGCVLADQGSVCPPARRAAAQLAVGYLGHAEASVRHSAAGVLNRVTSDVTMDQEASYDVGSKLEPALSDLDPRVSQAAARALTKMAPKHEAAATALRQLQHTSPQARRVALEVLGQVRMRSQALVRRVIELLTDDDWQVRAMAARTLPRLVERGQTLAADALQAALEDCHPVVRQNAAGALAHVAAHPSLPFLLKAQRGTPLKRRRC